MLRAVSVALLVVLLETRGSEILNDAHIYRSFASDEIVPEVVDEAPDCWLRVSYKSGREAEGGNRLTPTQTRSIPSITFNANDRSFYSLIMTDPDAPSRDDPKHREFVHWIVGNIQGNDLERADTIVEYFGAAPPKGTGLHRFVFLLYEHSERLDFANEPRLSRNCRNPRRYFSTKNFARKYGLTNLWAGNYFQALYDDYVPILQGQLSECTQTELTGPRNGTAFGG
ncbi:protein D2-like isoform X2 [Culex pipiens pallens]|uniref:protein D2-like isoform X2 n=1 Tax=Culex pipiens pallens TaxID=42434 RepID=UPI001953A0B4|nr:protein D2-like isoform X2 [Culex pipiens pallens]